MDKLTAKRRSENMRRIKSKGMKPEMKVRRLAHSLGYRFRLHSNDLAGKPDLVFRRLKKVIFVHGCFWHQHQSCREGRLPGTNIDYWGPKLAKNTARDHRNQIALAEEGWDVEVIWECETVNEADLKRRIIAFLDTNANKKEISRKHANKGRVKSRH